MIAIEKARMDEHTQKEQEQHEQKDVEDSEKFSSHHTYEKELSEQEGGGGEEQATPFILKKCTQEQQSRKGKKQMYDKQTHLDPMVLTEGDINEIGDKIRDPTIKLLQHFKQYSMHILRIIQNDLHELYIQASKILHISGTRARRKKS